MTQQYLAGELSVLLAQLLDVAGSRALADTALQLRRECETVPVPALSRVVSHALALTDTACWRSIEHGDTASFARQAAIASQLYEFGVCAELIQECRYRNACHRHGESQE